MPIQRIGSHEMWKITIRKRIAMSGKVRMATIRGTREREGRERAGGNRHGRGVCSDGDRERKVLTSGTTLRAVLLHRNVGVEMIECAVRLRAVRETRLDALDQYDVS